MKFCEWMSGINDNIASNYKNTVAGCNYTVYSTANNNDS